MNLEPHTDETRGYDLADHLEVLLRHAPDLPGPRRPGGPQRRSMTATGWPAAVEAAGARLEIADLAVEPARCP